MEIRKVSIDDREVARKRRFLNNAMVSFWVEEFSCEGAMSYINYTYRKKATKSNIGISKREHKISNRFNLNSYISKVNGAT